MEELKHEHEMRERRNQEREQWRDGRHNESSAVSLLPVLLNVLFQKIVM